MSIAPPCSISKLVNHEKPHIQILRKFITQVSSIHCLGMIVDQFIRWDKHVGALSKKISSATSSIKVIGCFTIQGHTLVMYHSLIEFKLCYCQ